MISYRNPLNEKHPIYFIIIIIIIIIYLFTPQCWSPFHFNPAYLLTFVALFNSQMNLM